MVFNDFYNAENPDIEGTCEFIAIENIMTEFYVKILKLQLKNGTCEHKELSSLYNKLMALEKEST
jgi:hypothetical protein